MPTTVKGCVIFSVLREKCHVTEEEERWEVRLPDYRVTLEKTLMRGQYAKTDK